MELCGGTHVSNTSEIRGFKVISEQGIASGTRRIEAVAGEAFIEYVSARDNYMKQLCSTLKVSYLVYSSTGYNLFLFIYYVPVDFIIPLFYLRIMICMYQQVTSFWISTLVFVWLCNCNFHFHGNIF